MAAVGLFPQPLPNLKFSFKHTVHRLYFTCSGLYRTSSHLCSNPLLTRNSGSVRGLGKRDPPQLEVAFVWASFVHVCTIYSVIYTYMNSLQHSQGGITSGNCRNVTQKFDLVSLVSFVCTLLHSISTPCTVIIGGGFRGWGNAVPPMGILILDKGRLYIISRRLYTNFCFIRCRVNPGLQKCSLRHCYLDPGYVPIVYTLVQHIPSFVHRLAAQQPLVG